MNSFFFPINDRIEIRSILIEKYFIILTLEANQLSIGFFFDNHRQTKSKEILMFKFPNVLDLITIFSLINFSALCISSYFNYFYRSPMVRALNCGLEGSEIKLRSRNFVNFRTRILWEYMKSVITLGMDWIVSLFFYKDGFGIK